MASSGYHGIKLGSPRSSLGSQNARCIVVNYNSSKDMIINVSYKAYSICIILHRITELKYSYTKSRTMFIFLVAKLGYQVQIPGSLSTFQVACGYWATTKSYTGSNFILVVNVTVTALGPICTATVKVKPVINGTCTMCHPLLRQNLQVERSSRQKDRYYTIGIVHHVWFNTLGVTY